MVELSVAGLALDASTRSPIVLLRDPTGRRQIPIWIDQAQAHNIIAGLHGAPVPRPLSHDLMVSLLEAGNLHLERVIIHTIEDSTFRAVLKLRAIHAAEKGETDQKEAKEPLQLQEAQQPPPPALIEVDSRPSDAIALAVRTHSSIWMLEEVVAEASIAVDEEADAEDQDEFRKFVDQVSPAALIRHLQNREPPSDESFGSTDADPTTSS